MYLKFLLIFKNERQIKQGVNDVAKFSFRKKVNAMLVGRKRQKELTAAFWSQLAAMTFLIEILRKLAVIEARYKKVA